MALGGLRASLLAGAALLITAAPAYAADLGRGSLKDAPAAAESWTASAYIQGTNDYIFRGISQTRRDPAIQGGADISYGWFYAGAFVSNLDFTGADAWTYDAKVEFDVYLGIKPKVGETTLDLGIITYNYYHNSTPANFADPTYQEIKAGASRTLFSDLTVGGTFFWSPDYFGQMGQAITLEGTASKPIAKIQGVELAASGTIGHTFYERDPSFNDYTYWNLGVTATYKSFSLDLRYWDSDLDKTYGCASWDTFQCGSAFAGTLKYSF